MTRERLIAEIESMAQAARAEETMKTGYSEVVIETLVQWMAAEEDLESSYGKLSKALGDKSQKEAAAGLQKESATTVMELAGLLKTFESMDKARAKRVALVKRLG
jgi:tRNA nucleotidyltransferase/poly(A) polymerase